jgi:DNA-3-methyladenine glycosylase II
MNWMLDHPGWNTTTSPPSRALRAEDSVWLHTADDTTARPLSGGGTPPHVDVYDPAHLHGLQLPPALRRSLLGLGPVRRLRNTDLWDALVTAIIRQVIRAGQARMMYRDLVATVGQPAGAAGLIPTAGQILAMSAETFTALGMAFKRQPLQATAAAYLKHGGEWADMPGDVLVKALQTVPRIGPWTAGAAVADHTGDFSLYPYGDLAVRTWARRADPATHWPDDEPSFSAAWNDLAGPHLSVLTALTLAWGDQHVHQPPAHPWSPH